MQYIKFHVSGCRTAGANFNGEPLAEVGDSVAKTPRLRHSVFGRKNIIPLEVKSGTRTTHVSLEKFCRKFKDLTDSPTLVVAQK